MKIHPSKKLNNFEKNRNFLAKIEKHQFQYIFFSLFKINLTSKSYKIKQNEIGASNQVKDGAEIVLLHNN